MSRPAPTATDAPSIVVLVVYFGSWPRWFELFLAGCRRNPTVDFLFVTDCGEHERIEAIPNCRVHATTLAEVAQRAQEVCGTPVALETPYKLCDLKPAYGDLFEELTRGYDYWAWTDIDLVYGDLRSFLGELDAYDCFFVNDRWVSGVFGLMRNTEPVRRLYRDSADWQRSFADPAYTCFDECAFLWSALTENPDLEAHEAELDSFTHVARRAQHAGTCAVHFEQLVHESVPQQVHVAETMREKDGRAFLLFHFVTAKSRLLWAYPSWSEAPDEYWVGPHGFHRRPPGRARALASLLRPSAVRQVLSSFWRKGGKALGMLSRGDVGAVARDLRRRIG